jgi:hypothetical protein
LSVLPRTCCPCKSNCQRRTSAPWALSFQLLPPYSLFPLSGPVICLYVYFVLEAPPPASVYFFALSLPISLVAKVDSYTERDRVAEMFYLSRASISCQYLSVLSLAQGPFCNRFRNRLECGRSRPGTRRSGSWV